MDYQSQDPEGPQNGYVKKIIIAVLIFIVAGTIILWLAQRALVSEKKAQDGSSEIPAKEDGGQRYNFVPKTQILCAAVGDKTKKQECFDSILMAEAIGSLNSDKCLGIKTLGTRNDCLYAVAVDVGGIDLCKRIADPEVVLQCVSSISISLKNPGLCEEGERAYETQECKDRAQAFVISESGRFDDIGECAKLETLEYSNLCFANSLNNKFKGDCRLVPEELYDQCFAQVAIMTNPTQKTCKQIAIKEYRDFCGLVVQKGLSQAMQTDTDMDGVLDGKEIFMRTDPQKSDTDGDGLTDKEELFDYRTNPIVSDTDGDGLDDFNEIKIYQTDPNSRDTDGDGAGDGEEVKSGKNPADGDTDKDGLKDEFEKRIGTDPRRADSDNDKMTDLYEWERGVDPLKTGAVLSDTDNDGILDVDEIYYGTDRLVPDKTKDNFLKMFSL